MKAEVSKYPIHEFEVLANPKQYRKAFRLIAGCVGGLLLAALTSIQVQAQVAQDVVATGHNPIAVAVNPITDRIYVANVGTAAGPSSQNCDIDSTGYSVTIIDGATDRTQTVPVGFCPQAIVVDPVSNKIYVAEDYVLSSQVTIIDGESLTTSQVNVGGSPKAFAVNPVTHKIYVADINAVWVIDGVTNTSTRVPIGYNPNSIAINSVTNKIYVANSGDLLHSANLAIIDGSNNGVSTVATQGVPRGVAVNPVTNQIYVSYDEGSKLSKGLQIIDGNTNATKAATLGFESAGTVRVNPATGTIYVLDSANNHVNAVKWPSIDVTPTSQELSFPGAPTALAIDPVANKVWVSMNFSAYASVIDGSTNQVTNIPLKSSGASNTDIAVNSITGKAYLVNDSNSTAVVLGATSPSNTLVATGGDPDSIVVNPNTNRAYTANGVGNSVTVIDGVSDQSVGTVTTGLLPFSISANPLTNKIYTADSNSSQVTAIDEKTLTTIAIPTLSPLSSLTVDSLNDTVYVGLLSNSALAISGATNTAQTLGPTGVNPGWIVTNPDTGQIYILNQNSNSVTVFDGTGGAPTTAQVGSNPVSAAIDSLIGNVYIANQGEGTVTLVGGPSNATGTVGVGTQPTSVAVNNVTNKIYVANRGSNSVTVINALDNTTSTVNAGSAPSSVAVNPSLNRIYVANYDSNNVTEIDGRTNAVLSTVPVGTQPQWVAVNVATNKVYVANRNSNNVSILLGEQPRTNPLVAAINSFPNNISSTPTPSFTFKATSAFSPTATVPDAVFFQLDTTRGPWTLATMTGPGAFKGTAASALTGGVHTLYAFATDGQAASQGNSPLISNIAAYTFATPATNGASLGGPPSFTLIAESRSLSVAVGQSVTDTLTIASLNGFNQPVTFACTGLPTGASCSFSPATATPNGSATASTTLTIATVGPTVGDAGKDLMRWPLAGGGITMGFAFFLFGRKRQRPEALWLVVLLCLGGMMIGCGKATTVVNPGTSRGNYAITVTATSGAGTTTVSKTVKIALAVN